MKQREFWIKKYEDTGWTIVDSTAHPEGLIHAIENNTNREVAIQNIVEALKFSIPCSDYTNPLGTKFQCARCIALEAWRKANE